MKRLEYIGLKQDGERAFKEHTGIEWMPGDVHDVKPEHAEQMLKHTDVWREVAREPAALATTAVKTPSPDLPEWVKKGIELGANDDQLEAIAQAGGPETEQGAALWSEATAGGTASKEPARPAAKNAVKNTTKKAAK